MKAIRVIRKLSSITMLLGVLFASSSYSQVSLGYSPVPSEISRLNNSGNGKLQVFLKTIGDKTHYQKGESIQYTISSNMPCYFCLLSFQEDGTWMVLYPNPYESDTQLSPQSNKIIPNPENNDYRYIVDAPYGNDTVCIVASSVEPALTYKLKEIADDDPSYVALYRGIFPMKVSTPSEDEVLWDIDWMTVTTSEEAPTGSALFLTPETAVVFSIAGFLMLLFSGILLKKRIF